MATVTDFSFARAAATQPTADQLLAAALAYAARGYRVFPCVEGAKEPAIPRFYEAATTDPDTIRAWWRDPVMGWPLARNIGVDCSHMIVVDIDVKNGKGGEAAFAALGLPDTFTTLTPSGGRHAYFTGPPKSLSVGKLGDGLDIRSHHGFVLAPGSWLDPAIPSNKGVGGTYEIINDVALAAAPPHLIAKLDEPRERNADTATPATEPDTDAAIARAAKYLRDEAPLAIEGAGGDDTTFRVAAIVKDMGLSEVAAFDVMAEHWNDRCTPPWELDELQRKVENAFAYGLSAAGSQSPAVDFGGVADIPAPIYAQGSALDREQEAAARPLRATPFALGDMTALPLRPWVYGKRNIRKYMSAKFAPGGVGKSAMSIADALAMASGRSFMGQSLPAGPLRVWLINLEDPRHELQLRIGAAMMHHRVSEADLGGRLFVDSGREQSLLIAEQTRDGARICAPVVDALVAELIARKIDVLSVDPFVSSHRVTENDNNAMDLVAKEWGRVADRANCSVELVHHTRKLNGGEVTVDSGRGGGALADATRSVLVLNRMTTDEAQRAAIDDHRRYFRAFPDKANLGPPVDASDWYRLVSVTHPNGEDVGVVECWKWPDPFEDLTADDLAEVQSWVGKGSWRENSQSTDWVGHAVGQALGVDTSEKGGRAKVLSLVKTWIASGVLVVVERPDQNRKMRKFVETGSGNPLAVKEERR